MDVGRKGTGLLVLLADISVGGLLSPVGLASVALFALLYASGEFGSPVPFVAEAPSASEGNYYTLRELPDPNQGIVSFDTPNALDEQQ